MRAVHHIAVLLVFLTLTASGSGWSGAWAGGSTSRGSAEIGRPHEEWSRPSTRDPIRLNVSCGRSTYNGRFLWDSAGATATTALELLR